MAFRISGKKKREKIKVKRGVKSPSAAAIAASTKGGAKRTTHTRHQGRRM